MQQEAIVHNIFHLNTQKAFSENEAYDLVNLLLAVTAKAKNKINGLNSRLEYYKALPEQADQIQLELNEEIQKWSEKVRRLGGIPLALFKVKIPGDADDFTWEFPSADITIH
jgi:hypothetical protein